MFTFFGDKKTASEEARKAYESLNRKGLICKETSTLWGALMFLLQPESKPQPELKSDKITLYRMCGNGSIMPTAGEALHKFGNYLPFGSSHTYTNGVEITVEDEPERLIYTLEIILQKERKPL